jgi:hypothetical protein
MKRPKDNLRDINIGRSMRKRAGTELNLSLEVN